MVEDDKKEKDPSKSVEKTPDSKTPLPKPSIEKSSQATPSSRNPKTPEIPTMPNFDFTTPPSKNTRSQTKSAEKQLKNQLCILLKIQQTI